MVGLASGQWGQSLVAHRSFPEPHIDYMPLSSGPNKTESGLAPEVKFDDNDRQKKMKETGINPKDPWGDEEEFSSMESPSKAASKAPSKAKAKKQAARPLSVPCETCRQRKVKCDRGLPACGWCTKKSQTCEYKERKKPGLRAGYGRELEGRLAEQAGLADQIHATLATIPENGSDVNEQTAPLAGSLLLNPTKKRTHSKMSLSVLQQSLGQNQCPCQSSLISFLISSAVAAFPMFVGVTDLS
ncbi:hypothetical protein EJ06DRAFT_550986 [Trichodelitschia bisporula]|uniref:Zn(2)-C6 fungal-type domain-containing protein n=1 Tax=Trichodelitschia bisporula TaxID=703511 RepID=A0A6G1HNI7_9PEZI|nr:hypothetical protein EJ06DRAFT_550986 [Trichodelitschia bisporula]